MEGEMDFDIFDPKGREVIDDPVIEDMPNLYDEMEEEKKTLEEEIRNYKDKNKERTLNHPPSYYQVQNLEDQVNLLLWYLNEAKKYFEWINDLTEEVSKKKEKDKEADEFFRKERDKKMQEERENAEKLKKEFEELYQKVQEEKEQRMRDIEEKLEKMREEREDKEEELLDMEGKIKNLEEENFLLLRESLYKLEEIRQLRLGIEDLERFIIYLKEVMEDTSRTDEERETAKEKMEGIQERVAVLESRKDRLETELSDMNKERIKIRLMKYGVPAALASLLAALISLGLLIKASLKENGRKLERQGKEIIYKNPGISGSVVALIKKTLGSILEFVGNIMWILLVVMGLLILLKI